MRRPWSPIPTGCRCEDENEKTINEFSDTLPILRLTFGIKNVIIKEMESKEIKSDIKILAEVLKKGFEDINQRFEDINKRFEDMNNRISFLQWLITAWMTILTLHIVLFKFVK